MALPHSALGWSAVCDGVVSCIYLLLGFSGNPKISFQRHFVCSGVKLAVWLHDTDVYLTAFCKVLYTENKWKLIPFWSM